MIKTTSTSDIQRDIFEAITAAIKSRATEVFDKAIKQAVIDAEAVRDKTIAGAVMRISSWYTFQDMGRTLRIEVIKPVDPIPVHEKGDV